MKNKKYSSLLKEWYEGNLSFDERMDNDSHKKETAEVEEKEFRLVKDVEKAEKELTAKGYKFFSVIFCVILASILILTVNFMPLFADNNTPTTNEVYEHYVGKGRDQTGAVNTVAGMILDYRAFDTLGESFVLFTATCAVLLLLEQSKKQNVKEKKEKESFTFSNDPIVCTIVKIITPIIIVFGVYVLFNGHLSPGGGFSGGSVLGAGFILFAMAYGEDKAAKIITPKIIRVITICSLSFYCLAKSYSFFTGNEFNGVHSIITPGTPGDIVSGGLILPLNIAVGLVVCCTMYSFYMVFKRGRLD